MDRDELLLKRIEALEARVTWLEDEKHDKLTEVIGFIIHTDSSIDNDTIVMEDHGPH